MRTHGLMHAIAVYANRKDAARYEVWVAAAESLRAALFAAKIVVVAPALLPLAAVLARSVAPGAPLPKRAVRGESPLPPFGLFTPLADGQGEATEEEIAFTRELHSAQRLAGLQPPDRVETAILLSLPGGDSRTMLERADIVYTFAAAGGGRIAEVLRNVRVLDAEWRREADIDPETGRERDASALPLFGVLLQKAIWTERG